MTNWCAYFPLTGKQEITAIYTPLEGWSTKEIVFKVNHLSVPYIVTYRTSREAMLAPSAEDFNGPMCNPEFTVTSQWF